jgi:probable O-glycosylation ligase (exosortase A-associated)
VNESSIRMPMLRSFLIISATLALITIAVFGRIQFGLWAYWWLAFFRPEEWSRNDFIVSFKISYIFALLIVAKFLISREKFKIRNTATLAMMMVLLGGLVAHFNAYDSELSLKWVLNFASLTLISIIGLSVMNRPRDVFISFATIILGIGYYSGKAGIASIVLGGGGVTEGLGGAFPDSNGFALASALVAPLLLSCANCNPYKNTLGKMLGGIFIVMAIGSFVTIIQTGSRGGFLAIASALATLLLLEKAKARVVYIIIILIASIAAADVLFTDEYLDRLSTITSFEERGEKSAMSRVYFWGLAIKIFFDNPFGVGFFNFGYAYNNYDTTDGLYGYFRPVHNSHLQILTEGGVISFLGWALAIFGVFYQNFKIIRSSKIYSKYPDEPSQYAFAKGLMASLIAFIVGSTFGNYAYNDLYWTVVSLSSANYYIYKSNEVAGLREIKRF